MSIIRREKKSFIIVFIEIAVLLIGLIGIPLGIYMHDMADNAGRVIDESYWQITLPSDKEMEKVLKEHTGYGPHGEGIRHGVYIVERNKIKQQFRTDPNAEIEELCMGYCEELETEQEYRPDFSQEYRWRKFEKYDDTLILVYFADEERLHVFVDIF